MGTQQSHTMWNCLAAGEQTRDGDTQLRKSNQIGPSDQSHSPSPSYRRSHDLFAGLSSLPPTWPTSHICAACPSVSGF